MGRLWVRAVPVEGVAHLDGDEDVPMGSLWGLYGSLWASMVSMSPYGSLWVPMVPICPYGFLWVSVVSLRSLGVSMGPWGSLCLSMGPYGVPIHP